MHVHGQAVGRRRWPASRGWHGYRFPYLVLEVGVREMANS